jgi:thioredoxin 1
VLERLLIVFILMAAGVALYCLYRQRHLQRIHRLATAAPAQTAADPILRQLRPDVPTIVYFTTPGCIPCKTQQQPALARLNHLLEGRLQIIQIDASQEPETAGRWGVMTAPTTFILGKDGTPVAVNYGVADEHKLGAQLRQAA